MPVAAANVPLGLCEVQSHDGNGGNDDDQNAEELEHHEEAVQSCAGASVDRVGGADEKEYQHREELVRKGASSVDDARGRVGALDEDDAQDRQGRGHNGNDPGPGGEETPQIAEDVLKVRLDASLARDGGAELGKRRRASPCQDATDEPDDQSHAGRRDVGVNGARGSENAAADDDADDDAEGLDGAEIPRECAAGGGVIALGWGIGLALCA
jgi:hypothetical protein